MSSVPPPTIFPIFNPINYPQDNEVFVDFPRPQGALQFDTTDRQLIIGSDILSIGKTESAVTSGIAFNADGFAYDNGTTTSTTTWGNLQTKIAGIQAISQASNATTLNINNTVKVQNGETTSTPTPYVSLTADAVGTRLNLNGDAGSNGYVLTSGGASGSLSWAEGGGGGTPNLQEVLDVGSSASDITITLSDTFETRISSTLNNRVLGFTNYDPATTTKSIDIGVSTPSIIVSNLTNLTQDKERSILTDTSLVVETRARFPSVTPQPKNTITKSIMTIDDGALNGDNKTIEVEPTGITISEFDNSVLTNEIIMDNEGFSVENITTGKVAYINLTAGLSLPPSSAITLENTAGTNGYVITSNGTTASWQPSSGGGGWVGTATSDLNMDIYAITSGTGTLNLSATDIDITGQATFNSPPHVPEPILGNDAASKGYVDSLVGQYSGGFNLFMNYSNTDPTYSTFKELSPLVDSAAQQTVPTSLTTNSPFLLSQFITLPLGITEIPIGLWDLFLYALVNTAQDSTTAYFELWKRPPVGSDLLLGTSGTSGDINNTNTPTSYSMVLTISTAIPLQLSDRVYIKIYGQTTHNNTVILTTYYEGNDYSFVQTTLNAGTTLLSSNNTWTGTNNFVLNPTTPSKTTPANTDIINYADIQRLSTPIVSTLDYYITTDSPFFQYPPAPPTNTLLNTYQYYGWYFINSVIGRNFSWYFAPDYAMTVADVKGLYMNYFNITTTSNDNCPFISIYTKPTGTNDVIPGFAHSVNTFVPTFTPIAATPFCSFMNISGTQQDPFPYGHVLGAMAQSTVNNPRGEYLSTEEVLAVAVGSNSGSALNQVAFIMSKVGICLEQGNQELILNPQNIIVPPNLTQTLTSGNAAGGLSITGVNNLAATSVTTPTLANGAATLTIGTAGQITNVLGTLQNNGAALPAYISAAGVASGSIDMNSNSITECNSLDSVSALTLGGTAALGTTLGRSSQTTNLVGNVQINGSSGTSGQVLTSTGATTAPTFQALTIALSPNVQNNITSNAISMAIGLLAIRSLNITIVSGGKYLINAGCSTYSSGGTQQNSTLMLINVGQSAQTASPSPVDSVPITTNTGFMNAPLFDESNCMACVKFNNIAGEKYTLANSYVWTAPAAAAGARTVSMFARASGTITGSVIVANYVLSVTRIA